MDCDTTDLAILEELQLDGRLTNQELADRVGLSPSPCLRRVRRLESEGIVTGYSARVDARAVGLDIRAFVRLRLQTHGAGVVEEVESAIRSIPEIVRADLLAGDYDYLLEIAASSLDGYEQLLREQIRTVPHIASIETTFTIGAVKEPAPLPAALPARRRRRDRS